METLINSNQILGGTGSKIKILNVVQNGSLTRNGSVYSDFSSSNYLQLGDNINGGYISLGNNVKNFNNFFSTANSWEVNGSFTLGNITNNQMILSSDTGESKGIYFYYNYNDENPNNTLTIVFCASGGLVIIRTEANYITANTKYYFRLQFTGSEYKFYLNTDGETYDNTTLIGYETNANKCYDTNDLRIGKSPWAGIGSLNSDAEINLADWNIKKNGEYFWKGVETI